MAKDIPRATADDYADALATARAAATHLDELVRHLERAAADPTNPAMVRPARKSADIVRALTAEAQMYVAAAQRRHAGDDRPLLVVEDGHLQAV